MCECVLCKYMDICAYFCSVYAWVCTYGIHVIMLEYAFVCICVCICVYVYIYECVHMCVPV